LGRGWAVYIISISRKDKTMNVFKTLNRLTLTKGDNYSPVVFQGKWTREERSKMKATLSVYVPDKVGRMFNTWIFYRSKWGYNARRDTWEFGGIATDTIGELIDRIHNYYARKE
jgi:hypothetical protein